MIPLAPIPEFTEFTNLQSLWIYVGLFLVAISCYAASVHSTKLSDMQKKGIQLVVILMLSLFFGIRYFTGTDYKSYFALIENLTINITEPLNYFLYALGGINKQVTYFAYAFLTLFFVIKALDRFFVNSWYKIFSFTAYVFIFLPHSMNTMREGLALAILLFATSYLMKEQRKVGFVWFVVACLIHNEVLSFVPIALMFCWRKKLTYSITILYILVLLMTWLMSIMNLPFELPFRLKYYFDQAQNDWGIGILMISIPYFVYMYMLLIKKKRTSDFVFVKNLSIMVLSGIILRHLAYISFYFYRFSNPFNIMKIILFGFVPYLAFTYLPISKTKRNAWIIFGVFIIFNIIYFILEFYIGGTGEIFPYRFKLVVY